MNFMIQRFERFGFWGYYYKHFHPSRVSIVVITKWKNNSIVTLHFNNGAVTISQKNRRKICSKFSFPINKKTFNSFIYLSQIEFIIFMYFPSKIIIVAAFHAYMMHVQSVMKLIDESFFFVVCRQTIQFFFCLKKQRLTAQILEIGNVAKFS